MSKQSLKILLKDFTAKHTITSLAKETGMSRAGTWKALKKMESKKLIILSPVGKGKTNVYLVSLNFENQLTEKYLSLALTEDALKYQKWISNFEMLRSDFLILYGSILHSPKEANDIDLLVITNSFKEVDQILTKIQKTQLKKIHSIVLSKNEFKQELLRPNHAYIDAVKKGIVLLGQERFIEFMRQIHYVHVP